MIRAWHIGLLALALCGCELFEGGGDGLSVPDRHRAQCVAELIAANAKLAAAGYEELSDDPDKVVEVLPPERLYRGGGQIWLEQAVVRNGQWEGMWVGGYWSIEKNTVVAQPDGTVRAGRFAHEWGHDILHKNKVNATYHHEIMQRAGITGS